MNDIISVEAPRRKNIIKANKCEDIWALRKKGVKLPILYLVIDEYITVKNKLAEQKLDKELDSKLQTLISQLPSLGIRLIFVPHRATGVVNKTNRTMLQFTASVKGDQEEVIDTLGIRSWKRPLVKPGDIAIKTSSSPEAQYVRGAAVTVSDETNSDFIENAAKVFYKMGVDLTNWGKGDSYMSIAINRDEQEIKERLSLGNTLQYDANHIFDNL